MTPRFARYMKNMVMQLIIVVVAVVTTGTEKIQMSAY